MPHDTPSDELVGVLSEEEIDAMLQGDRRNIDKLLLTNSNRLTSLVLAHMRKEDERNAKEDATWKAIGGEEAIKLRADYVDSLIKRQGIRNAMMEKVSQSTLTWALIAFLGFLATALWSDIIRAAKIKLGLPL
jgi:hypothetical protein